MLNEENVESETFTVEVRRDKETGIVLSMCWKNAAGEIHSPGTDHAAWWYKDKKSGVIRYEDWFKDGYLHREGGLPARIERGRDGLVTDTHYCVEGHTHRDGGLPAKLGYSDDRSVIEWHEYWEHGSQLSYSFNPIPYDPKFD